MQLVKLFVAASILHADATGDRCQVDSTGSSCNADAPSVGNAQLQSKLKQQKAQPTEMLEITTASAESAVPFVSFAGVSRRTMSQQKQLREAAEASQLSATKMESSWASSVNELNNVIGNIIDHSSSSEDKCSTDLLSYKQQLTVTHESTISLQTAVSSTMSQVTIFDKECKEKNDELNECELVEQTKLTKCTTEKTVCKKTLETLRYDLHEMQRFVRAHIHLQPGQTIDSRFPSSRPHLLQTGASNADPSQAPSQEQVDEVKSMVQETKSMAAKVTSCMGKAGKAASLMEVSDEPAPESSIASMAEVAGTSDESGAVPWHSDSSQSSQPPIPPPTPDTSAQSCVGLQGGDKCTYTMPNVHGFLKGVCKWASDQPQQHYMLLETNSKEASGDDSSPLPTILKCAFVDNPEPPSECKAVVLELEHQFSISYVSVTRIIEEYEQVVHSTVCEETVVQEYTHQSSAIQEDANKACSFVQESISKLEKFKFEYQASAKTEFDMQTTIRSLVKQCGSLTATEIYLGDVKDTLGALGKCPGLGDVTFQLPTWTGAWCKFDQDRSQEASVTDSQMRYACSAQFGAGARPAEVGEIDSEGIEGMPLTNSADLPVLAACPNCKGDFAPGLTATGYGRVCWDPGSPFTREAQRKNCGGGPRMILCVLEQGSSYSSSSSSISSSSSSSQSSGSSGSSSSYSSFR